MATLTKSNGQFSLTSLLNDVKKNLTIPSSAPITVIPNQPQTQWSIPQSLPTTTVIPPLVAAPAIAPVAAPTKTKAKADPVVLAKQKELNRLGAGLVEDGIMGPKTQAAIAKYSKPTASNLGITSPSAISSAQAPQQTQGSSLPDILTQILKSSQMQNASQYTGNNTALLAGKEAIEKTNAGVYSQDLKNANISNEARLSLLGNDNSIQNPGLRSIEGQQSANQARYDSTNDLIKSTQDTYSNEQDRAYQKEKDAADQAYKQSVLAETIRSNKASEGISAAKNAGTMTTGDLFGSAKLTTGQKSDVADMLVLQKQIASLQALGKDGYTGTSGFGGGSVQGVIEKLTGIGQAGGQDTRNAIGQIKGYIAKLRGGTSFTPNEQALLDTYTPGINDSDAVIESKLNSLNGYINDKLEATAMVAGGTYTPQSGTGTAGGGILKSPDGKLEVDTSDLTPAELKEAQEAGWK